MPTRVEYSEGLRIGYRWFDANGIAPRFPFGFGLSYTTFALTNLVRVAARRVGDDADHGVGARHEHRQTARRRSAAGVSRPAERCGRAAEAARRVQEGVARAGTVDDGAHDDRPARGEPSIRRVGRNGSAMGRARRLVRHVRWNVVGGHLPVGHRECALDDTVACWSARRDGGHRRQVALAHNFRCSHANGGDVANFKVLASPAVALRAACARFTYVRTGYDRGRRRWRIVDAVWRAARRGQPGVARARHGRDRRSAGAGRAAARCVVRSVRLPEHADRRGGIGDRCALGVRGHGERRRCGSPRCR